MSETLPEPDPATAALIARVKRLMLVTMGATFVALAIVLMVIGYRVLNVGGSAPPPSDALLQLPKGAKVLSATVSDGRIFVTIEGADGTEILSFDLKTLKPAGRIRLAPQ